MNRRDEVWQAFFFLQVIVADVMRRSMFYS